MASTPYTNLAGLMPGQAIHVGHSYVILNVAGVRIVLDPATDNGRCLAPFSNLTLSASAELEFLSPLVDPTTVVPSTDVLAQSVDVILCSHLHSDHFNARLLDKCLQINPKLHLVCPVGSRDFLRYRPYRPRPIWLKMLEYLGKIRFVNGYALGMKEYLVGGDPPKRVAESVIELASGEQYVLRKKPFVGVQAFEVRHPKPQMYVRMPFEPKELPPVLGYKVVYREQGAEKLILLAGEAATDSELLWQIWSARDRLVAMFVSIADEATVYGLKWVEDTYFHASLRLIGIAERLAGERTKIHCLHQGLWYYTLDERRVRVGREMIQESTPSQAATVEQIENAFENHRQALRERSIGNCMLTRFRELEALIRQISKLPLEPESKVRLHPVGCSFYFEN